MPRERPRDCARYPVVESHVRVRVFWAVIRVFIGVSKGLFT